MSELESALTFRAQIVEIPNHWVSVFVSHPLLMAGQHMLVSDHITLPQQPQSLLGRRQRRALLLLADRSSPFRDYLGG